MSSNNSSKSRSSNSRTHGKKAVIVPNSSSNSRIFKALQDRPYSGPEIPSNTNLNSTTKSKNRFPAFIDSNGNFYDIHYLPIVPEKFKVTASSDNLEQKLAFDVSSQIYTKMPRPGDYENFFRYEQALLEWKSNLQLALGSLKLPILVGRQYYRPRIVLERNRGSSVSGEYLPETHEMHKEEDSLSPEEEELYNNFPYRSDVTKKQFSKLLEKKRAQVLQLDDNKYFKLQKDPWDSNLLPQEPDPSYYDTYEDYAAAMKRWSAIAISQLNVIPPHASQLKDLIPIQTPEVETKEENKEPVIETIEKEEFTEKVITGLHEIEFLPVFPIPYPVPARKKTFQKSESLGKISPESAAKVQEFIDTLLKAQNEKYEKNKSFTKSLLPIIHGTFPKPSASGGVQKLKSSNKNKILRRTDLTGPMISSCMDCPGEVEGKRVEFKIPDYDVENIPISKLLTDSKLRDQTKTTLRQIQYSDRNDYLCSWFFPTLPKEFHSKHRSQIDQIFKNVSSDKVTIANIISVLEIPMFLDKFQDLLTESMPEGSDGVVRTYLQAFLNIITPDNFWEILVLFEIYNSRLFHAKLSVLVSETLQSGRAKIILESLIQKLDVKSLGFVAYAMQFFNEVPVEIYPYIHQWTDLYLIIPKMNECFDKILPLVFTHYYVHLISETMAKHPFIFVAINQFVIESRKAIAYNLVTVLEQNPEFLSNYIWKFINHRSSFVSSFFFFVMIRLLNNRDSMGFKEILTSNGRLLENLKKLSLSKYSHTQFAVKKIFRKLQMEPWEDWLYSNYNSNPNLLLEELTLPKKKNGELSLYSELVLEMCQNIFEKTTKSNLSKTIFLFRDSFFFSALDLIIKNQKQIDETHEALCILLSNIIRSNFQLGAIKPIESVKGSSRNSSNGEFPVIPGDLQKLISLISEIERKDRSDKKYIAKRYILCTLRLLIKHPGVWEFLKKEGIFFSSILSFCRDGKDKEFNREAWRTFYQIIFYHHGVLEYLLKQNTLGHFVELVGTSSAHAIMINGLHYIGKLFSMPVNQQRRLSEGKYEARQEIVKESFKTFEKDTKKLNSFFVEKSLFIKIHMIYKKIGSMQQGLTFLELAKFYHALSSIPQNSKLYKDTTKKQEYKAGLQSIHTMFSPDSMLEDSPTSVTKKSGVMKLLSSRSTHKE